MVHLVGSIPFRDCAAVFEQVSAVLGPALRALPDGETGERLSWMGWLEPIFAGHPQFESAGEKFAMRPGSKEVTSRFKLKAGMRPDDVRFDDLPFAQIAIESYREFARLKQAGVIPQGVRFQVTLAGPLSVLRRFVADEAVQEALLPAYEEGMKGEIARMAAAIPHDQLAVQWDVASAVFERLERAEPTRYGRTVEEMMATFVPWHARIGMNVPGDVHLYYHLCYGDADHRHSIEPGSAALLVDFANRLCAYVGRTIELIHMPVPRGRLDDAYYEPLARLKLRPETRLALGLVHHTDGIEGTRTRIAIAQKYAPDFAIATECGFGRRAPETITRLLQIHAEAAGIAAEIDLQPQ
jgi:hypothetical protein